MIDGPCPAAAAPAPLWNCPFPVEVVAWAPQDAARVALGGRGGHVWLASAATGRVESRAVPSSTRSKDTDLDDGIPSVFLQIVFKKRALF